MSCHGNGPDHCCYFAGVVCPHLEENTVVGRRWACGLLRELGNWDAVVASDRYQENVQPRFDTTEGIKGMNCRDWPQAYPELMAADGGLCCHG